MIKIRLSRRGHKNAPMYRVVAAPARSRRDGKPVEVLGYYNPAKKDLKLDKKRVDYWREKGALITQGVEKLIK